MRENSTTLDPRGLNISEAELLAATGNFINDNQFGSGRAVELLAAATFSYLTEPGDRMMGFLIENLGRTKTLQLLINGFDVPKISQLLKSERDDIEVSVGDLIGTLWDSRERWLPRLNQKAILKIFDQCLSTGIKIVLPEDNYWPVGLDDLGHNAPRILYLLGDESKLPFAKNSVSIVGSRQATSYGLEVTENLVAALSKSGRGTVSGGAVGIDTATHRGSLKNGSPTIAVMAGGLDLLYPKINNPLFLDIKKENTIMSELPPGVAPTRWRFLQRNRLIAALSPTTVVVEAAIRSGATKTANDALLLDRELWAVPGAITTLTSQGTNELITSGKAKALTSVEDFLGGKVSRPKELAFSSNDWLTASETRAADALRVRPMALEELKRVSGLTQFEAESALKELENKRMVKSLGSIWMLMNESI
jgi:DNA processing protein